MPTLLIVDDHPGVLQTLEFVLATETLHVALTTCGTAAIELTRRQRIDAALVDLHMPGMDGLTLCRRLCEQAQCENRRLPVWIMTAAPTAQAGDAARSHGAVALLRKPFDCPAFREELLRSLSAPLSDRSVPVAPFAA